MKNKGTENRNAFVFTFFHSYTESVKDQMAESCVNNRRYDRAAEFVHSHYSATERG